MFGPFEILESDISVHLSSKFVERENVIKNPKVKGFNPGLIVLNLVGGLLLTFLDGNYLL